MSILVTADPHYYHGNIIRYAKRPFAKPGDLTDSGDWKNRETSRIRAREMTEQMILWHNEIVKPNDTVICLGDFSFGGTAEVISLLRRLNGNYEFVWGNHDKALKDFSTIVNYYPDLKPRVKFLGNMAEVVIEGQKIVLCHFAMRTWNKSHRGTWHLYGHSHGTLPDDPNSMSIDVGVDCNNLRPFTLYQIKDLMKNKTFKPIDHHGDS